MANRNGFAKPEFHLLMPIFSTRSQFESYKVEEIGKSCYLKWRLKDIQVFDWYKLSCAFNGYTQRENCGRKVNDKKQCYYTGYYIFQAV